MITASTPVFPNNVVEKIAERMDLIDADLHVVKRPIRNTDPQQSVGVYGQLWAPNDQSLEMRGYSPAEPTLQQYSLSVQAFVRDGDEENGLAVHSVLSSLVRSVLYRDDTLRIALQGLSVTHVTGVRESLKRWGIRTQRYFNNDIEGQWLYLSTLDFWMETEIY